MYGPTSRETSKPRYSKLRASCDTCFLAKVKCSKSRPICSRCLACGADCKYSPSSRAGKPKSDASKAKRASVSGGMSMPESSNTIVYSPHPLAVDPEHPTYGIEADETDWTGILGSPDGMMSRRSASYQNISMIGDASTPEGESSTNTEMYDPYAMWSNSSRADTSPPYMENQLHMRSRSIPDATAPPGYWYEPTDPNARYSSSAPGVAMPGGYNTQSLANTPTCNCFNTCLQALSALHNSDTVTAISPFDVILTVNQKAVETCSMMLDCPICMAKTGSSLRTMLLGAILGGIIAVYQDASQNYFGPSPGPSSIQNLPLTFGTYRVASEDTRWLQMEIILRDLQKLKELFAKFQEMTVKSESEEDASMHGAVTNYLCQSLHHTTEALKKQRVYSCGLNE